MRIEQVNPDKPSFPWVVFCFGAGIILIFIAAILFLKFHDGKKQQPPYTQHPVSQLVYPVSGSKLAA